MAQISIPIPNLRPDQTIIVEVTIDGVKQVTNYRVETFPWEEFMTAEDRIDHLRTYIRDYEDDWQMIQIGPPDDGLIPVMFKQRVLEPVHGNGTS